MPNAQYRRSRYMKGGPVEPGVEKLNFLKEEVLSKWDAAIDMQCNTMHAIHTKVAAELRKTVIAKQELRKTVMVKST